MKEALWQSITKKALDIFKFSFSLLLDKNNNQTTPKWLHINKTQSLTCLFFCCPAMFKPSTRSYQSFTLTFAQKRTHHIGNETASSGGASSPNNFTDTDILLMVQSIKNLHLSNQHQWQLTIIRCVFMFGQRSEISAGSWCDRECCSPTCLWWLTQMPAVCLGCGTK